MIQHVLFRLKDSLPDGADTPNPGEVLDGGIGLCCLGRDDVAEVVESALRCFDGERYRLVAWVIMPNHVHVVFEMMEGWTLARVLESWKTHSAKKANRILAREGKFWARGYFDRYVRDGRHLEALVRYVEDNPVKAGLVNEACEWRWGSAWHIANGWERDLGFGLMGFDGRPKCGPPSQSGRHLNSEREGGGDV